MTDEPLWQRLQAYAIDAPDAAFPFTRRLARDNAWPLPYAVRVVQEYKRFCYLAMSAGHHVTPSDAVDQAWHLHLIYTRDYWDDFCPNVLLGKLHHGPTRGGNDEGDKFKDWYARTLTSYAQHFGQAPPADIWPTPQKRFGRDAVGVRRIEYRYWWLKKPWHWWGVAALTTCLGTPALAQGPSLLPDPTAKQFLLGYSLLLVLCIAWTLLMWTLFRRPWEALQADDTDRTPEEAAYLSGGHKRVMETAAYRLLRANAIRIDPASGRLKIGDRRPKEPTPIEAGLLDAVSARARSNEIAKICQDRSEFLSWRLRELGLAMKTKLVWAHRLLVSPPFIMLILVGISRFNKAQIHHEPAGFVLLLLLAVTVLAFVFSLNLLRLSARGRRTLKAIRREHTEKATEPRDVSLTWAIALSGLSKKLSPSAHDLHLALYPRNTSSDGVLYIDDGTDCGSGCGSGCGGCGD